MQQGSANRTSQDYLSSSLTAGLAGVCFPGEDGGRSLGEMAQRDLDAALQLLADRAQYITGSSGAAIALRRNGMNDMMCRASSGANAPELGALLSTEFGLSGESVRTRQLLRCDDAERDARVNREVCRELGIASVAVMPVVNDDEVLGVFELFSGTPHAFGERDFAALKRLSEMVETAVKLARAAESLPEKLKAKGAAAEAADSAPKRGPEASAALPGWPTSPPPTPHDMPPQVSEAETGSRGIRPAGPMIAAAPASQTLDSAPPQTASPAKPASGRAILWSAALDGAAETESSEGDQSHLPAAFRSLRKCEACGFPISTGRLLCVECEEKKWRGQLRGAAKSEKKSELGPQTSDRGRQTSNSRTSDRAATSETMNLPAKAVVAGTPAQGFSAAAPALAPEKPKAMPRLPDQTTPQTAASGRIGTVSSQVPEPVTAGISTRMADLTSAVPSGMIEASRTPGSEPEMVLSAGLEPQQSWMVRNKFVLITMAVIAIGAVAFVLLH